MAQAAKASAAIRDIDAAEPMWSVIDTNAKEHSRTHHPLGLGRVTYVMSPGQPTSMPEAHAAKFLCDESFHVFDDAGRRVTSLRKPTDDEGEKGIQLADDEVIAKLDELGQEALLRRAHMQPGGEVFKKNARRDDLVEFLMEKRDPSAEGSIGAARRAAKEAGAAKSTAGDGIAEEDMYAEIAAMLDTGANE